MAAQQYVCTSPSKNHITPPAEVCANPTYATLYGFAVKFFEGYGFVDYANTFNNVLGQDTYELFYQPVADFVKTMNVQGARIVVTDTDGIVAIDTAQDNNTYANYQYANPGENFVVGNIGFNHNTRAAIMYAQLYPSGVGFETKFSNTQQNNVAYVAIRLGDYRNNTGTIRFSMDQAYTPPKTVGLRSC